MGRAYVIQHGRTREYEDVGEVDLAVIQSDPECCAARLVDGREHTEWDAARPHVEAIARMVCPQTIWFCAPGYRGFSGGSHQDRWGGLALFDLSVVLMRTDCPGTYSISCAYHEGFHAIERRLTDKEKRILTAAVRRGWAHPDAEQASDSERGARAFEDWAMSRFEAPRTRREGLWGWLADRLHMLTAPPEEKVFRKIFSGEVGRRRI